MPERKQPGSRGLDKEVLAETAICGAATIFQRPLWTVSAQGLKMSGHI